MVYGVKFYFLGKIAFKSQKQLKPHLDPNLRYSGHVTVSAGNQMRSYVSCRGSFFQKTWNYNLTKNIYAPFKILIFGKKYTKKDKIVKIPDLAPKMRHYTLECFSN